MKLWRATPAGVATVLAGAALLVVGAFAGRADVALLGAVPLLAGLLDLQRRPAGDVIVSLEPGEEPGGDGVLRATLRVRAPEGAAAVLVGLHRDGLPAGDVLLAPHDEAGGRVGWAARDGRSAHDEGAGAVARDGRAVPLVVRTVRTGPQEVATVDALGVGPGGASAGEPMDPVRRRTLVLPTAAPLRQMPLPGRLRGLTGPHGSRRPGEGGDLRDVHAFVPGDRLRRIDWRVTAKRSPGLDELYVRGEHALAEAVVVLVVDSRDDVGPDPRTWSGFQATRPDDATSLDVARRAALSVARAFLRAGDRVGLDDLGVLRRPLPPGGGRGQLDRVAHALALTRPEGQARHRVRSPRLPSGALVVVFSTFFDDEAAAAAAAWRRIGHRVVAVDVLPELRTRHLSGRALAATRLVLMAREDRLAELRDLGVEVIRWRADPAGGPEGGDVRGAASPEDAASALAGLARLDRRRPGVEAASGVQRTVGAEAGGTHPARTAGRAER